MTDVIHSVEDVIRVAREQREIHGGNVWWRGQPWGNLALRPKLFRRAGEDPIVAEEALFYGFRRQAFVRYDSCPDVGDDMAWLTLMQHHGLATRLLDWTFSPLIATFFAVKDHSGPIPDNWNPETPDPELFAFAPLEIHRQDQVGAMFQSDVDEVHAFVPDEANQRMFVQQSGFTIHGNAAHLPDTGLSSALTRYTVANDRRSSIRLDLRKLGIREATLFPDLDHLAADLDSLTWRVE